jgi:uncharacterized protein (DUF1778 family)
MAAIQIVLRNEMSVQALKRDVAVSMRLREEDLRLIDRGAELSNLSRTEFMRRSALHEAEMAVLQVGLIRMNADALSDFHRAIAASPSEMPEKLKERLGRPQPWRATEV